MSKIFLLKNKQKGFSLVEILIVVAILGLISVVLATFQVDIWRQNSFLTNSIQAEQDARIALKRLVAELRQAAPSDTGAFAIALADKDKLTFYSDIDGDGLHERLRYFLSGNILRRGIIKPTGSPLTYLDANEQVSNFVPNLVNSNSIIFTYFDKNYAGTSTALTLPINLPNVRLVKVQFSIEADPNRAPVTTTYESQVAIRSLKDNL
ncbi:MAG: prepilin-type N-terminal cleavage/methylation domain-containing protein [Patescibacteria group bacterium]